MNERQVVRAKESSVVAAHGAGRGVEKKQVLVRDPRTNLISAINTVELPWPSEAEIAEEIWPALRTIMLNGLEASDPLFTLPLPGRYLAHYRTVDANGLLNLLMRKFNVENAETHVFAHAKWRSLQFDVDRQ